MRLGLSIHSYIAILVIGTVLPFLVFSGLLVHRSTTSEQELIAESVRDAAKGAAEDIDRQIDLLQLLGLAAAKSLLLQSGDVEGFQVLMGELARGQNFTAILYGPGGQQLVNTDVPFGTPLPAEPAMVSGITTERRLEISDLTTDPRTGKPIVQIMVPVLHDHALAYVLVLQIIRSIASVMDQQLIRAGLTVGLVDRHGAIIYRTRAPEEVVGLSAPPDFVDHTRGTDKGSFTSISRSGVPIYIAFSRVQRSGWVLGVSIPRDDLFAPATHSLILLLLFAAGMLALAGLIAWSIGRSITSSVGDLARLAAALGAGEAIDQAPARRLREVNVVADAMISATVLLREQTDQRTKAVAALHTEIVNRRRIEQQLVQSQKLEAIGQLTGGLAHDFNNLLAIIIGNVDALRERWPDDRESDELAGAALEAALRGADLTRQMLAFARRQPLAPEHCDINQVIRTVVRLLRRTLGENIAIDLRLAPNPWTVVVDRMQFGTVITNLATNARDAMPAGGKLTIATGNTSLDQDYAASHSEVTPGDYVMIEVSDSGTGMSPTVLERIFEPFFTTKEPGYGTGLGLSMVFGFMKQSGGHITAYSEPGEGTTFRLYLPLAPDAMVVDDPVVQAPPEPGRNETILAVEDSAGLRQVLARQLTSAGYCVLEASNARMALDTIESDAKIDLLLTDVVMPGGMNGHELARVAAQRRPGLKMLLTTGFSDIAACNIAASELRILRKPYRKEDLLRVVRETLDC
jgi:signal transduction histidine kinase